MEGGGLPVVVRCGLGKSEETFIKPSLTPGVYYFFPLLICTEHEEGEGSCCLLTGHNYRTLDRW